MSFSLCISTVLRVPPSCGIGTILEECVYIECSAVFGLDIDRHCDYGRSDL
jgi:hypothetical protein